MIRINPEFKALIPPLTSDEYFQLEENIINEGCRDAIILWGDIIIDGHNRYDICTKHNIEFKTIQLEFKDSEEVKDWIDKNQLGRRNLTPDQRKIIIGRRYLRERKNSLDNLKQNAPIDKICTSVNTASKLANEYNTHPNTIKNYSKDAEYFKKLQDEKPELAKDIWDGNKDLREVKKEEKIEKRKNDIETIKKNIETQSKIIKGLYDVISIDPPWAYEEKGGLSTGDYDPLTSRGSTPYPSMTLTEISDIKLPLKDNAVVFLWTTHSFLHDAFHLIEQWNLTYKATMVWDKENMGIGRTIRMQCEFILIAIKGKPILNGSSERDIIREKRREHSRKPEAFYEFVERFTIGKRLDYFSRQKRENWDHYGAETEKF